MNVLLCVSSSIAAYKSLDLVSKLKQAGHEIVVAMTGNAQKIVTRVPFKSLSRNEVVTDLFADDAVIAHIALTEWCDVLVAAPASYNLISKIACGIADDAVTTLAAACRKPVLIAPAMNTRMYENPVLIENLDKLRKLKNYDIIEPAEGYLACGVSGRGRMAPVEEIIGRIEALAAPVKKSPLAGKNIIITAGPTREYIDTVRFLSNPSTGRMGYALAEASVKAGARVTLISGPVSIKPPAGIGEIINVVTTKEMLDAVIGNFDGAHVLISAAAPCDFTFSGKLSKKAAKIDIINNGGLKLAATEDILKAAAKKKKKQIVVGFAAEDNNHLENAVRKMKAKSMDMIVLNDVSTKETGFASDFNKITIIKKGLENSPADFEKATKLECAEIILENIEALMKKEKRKKPDVL
ncbi:MAG TPA: bifunctional phosphopantothenoylcysteine decarboxylase/phosphopantothenate--cysteine ligase CoaBC [Candidatus Wallbacteria bacterium]|nr:bifunctional phosphopantothenoylcysteine decarboxylase/phosphopantothenate--cysteine ligase CoaBC [Candidatus Wallbacteria bacterium]